MNARINKSWLKILTGVIGQIIGILSGVMIGTLIHTSIWPFEYCVDVCMMEHGMEREIILGVTIGTCLGIAGIITIRGISKYWIVICMLGWVWSILSPLIIGDIGLNGILPVLFWG